MSRKANTAAAANDASPQEQSRTPKLQPATPSMASAATSTAIAIEDHDNILPEHAHPVQSQSQSQTLGRNLHRDLHSVEDQRVISPTVARSVSRLYSVATTLGALTAQANRGWNSLKAVSTGVPPASGSPDTAANAGLTEMAARRDSAISPVYDAFENAGDLASEATDDGLIGRRADPVDKVEWSRWDRLCVGGPRPTPVLISAYASGTFQMLQVDGDDMKEVAGVASTAFQDHQYRYVRPPPRVLAACCRPSARAELILVVDAPLEVLAYSLETHTVLHRTRLSGPDDAFAAAGVDRCDLQCNERFTCIALSGPGSIHVLRTDGLQYAAEVLADVAASPHPAATAPISLSGRLLAYATTRVSQVSDVIADTRRSATAVSTPIGSQGAAGRSSGGAASGLTRDGGRSRSHTQGQVLLGVGDVREQMLETSAQVGDVARRVSGNVLSGMRTLGEWGSLYLAGASLSSPIAAHGAAPGHGHGHSQSQSPGLGPAGILSRSAPISSHLSQRSASSVSNSPRLGPVYDGVSSKRSSVHMHVDRDRDRDSQPTISSAVRIVDIGSSMRTLSTFVPSSQPVAHIALSPSGQLCLTADSLGHAFHVFELQATGLFGAGRDGKESPSPLLHRYKLLRGVTSAEVVSAQWSSDAQWVAVGTRTGTVHTYALNPFGGAASICNHVAGKIRNTNSIPPLSVTVSSLARTARPAMQADEATQRQESGHGRPSRSHNASSEEADGGVAESLAAAQAASAAPVFLMQGVAQRADGTLFAARTSSPRSATLNILTFDPKSATVSLHKAEFTSTTRRGGEAQAVDRPKTAGSRQADGAAAAATSSSAISSSAGSSSTTSGLTQMMRKAGGGLIPVGSSGPRLSSECHRIAAWSGLAPVSRPKGGDLPVILSTPAVYASRRRGGGGVGDFGHMTSSHGGSIANTEIETYSQSPRVLPASIYLSRQCFFRVFDAARDDEHIAFLTLHRKPSVSIAVREVATVIDLPGADALYSDRLAGAFDDLNLDDIGLGALSPSSRIPSFPQGQRAKTASWSSRSIPIRTVAGGIGTGIYRAGRELSRGVEMARKRTSGGGAVAVGTSVPNHREAEQRTIALSFDEEDGEVDLFSDLRSRLDRGLATSMTSHLVPESRSGRGSQPSSAETPPTDFSPGSRPGPKETSKMEAYCSEARAGSNSENEDDDEALGWDPVADRDMIEGGGKGGNERCGGYPTAIEGAPKESVVGAAADDFILGGFDEDDELDGGGMCNRASVAALTARAQSPCSDVTATALVYNVRGSGPASSGRSSLRATAVIEQTQQQQQAVKRGESPAPSTRSDTLNSEMDSSSSGDSGGSGGGSGVMPNEVSGQLCEGGKETHTSTPSPTVPGSISESVSVVVGRPTSTASKAKNKIKAGKR